MTARAVSRIAHAHGVSAVDELDVCAGQAKVLFVRRISDDGMLEVVVADQVCCQSSHHNIRTK